MYKKTAEEFCNAIKALAANEDSLFNLQCYLECHFDNWLKNYADTPENITAELVNFARIGDELK